MKKPQFLEAKMKKKNRVYNLFSIALGTACATTGGRGDLVGAYPDTGMFFLAVNFNWVF